MNWWALGAAAGLCAAMVAAEGALSGKELQRWLSSLRKPLLYPPLWVWIFAALVTYVIQGAIAYRLLRSIDNITAIALALLIVLMSANVAYNVVLERSRNPRFAFMGVVWFLPILAALQVALHFADQLAAVLNWIYVAWVVCFDLPIMRALARLNR